MEQNKTKEILKILKILNKTKINLCLIKKNLTFIEYGFINDINNYKYLLFNF